MNNNDKASLLARLNEAQLRKRVLVPLLGRMGFRAPTLYHGPREKGKDIICFDFDKLGERVYMAIVAKTGDINGTVASDRGVRAVCTQVEQCFDVPYEDLFGMKQVTMDYVWVVTNGKVLTGAAESIIDHLRKQNLSKLIRFIQVEQLVALIDEHFSAYWNSAAESIEGVRGQRDRAYLMCGEILRSIGATKQQVNLIRSQLQNSEHLPRVQRISEWRISAVSPYAVEVDRTSSQYDNALLPSSGASVRDQFVQTRRDLDALAGELYSLSRLCNQALQVYDPNEFLDYFKKHLARQDVLHGPVGYAEDLHKDIEHLKQAVHEVDHLRRRLEEHGTLEWAISVSASLDVLLPDAVRFVRGIDCDEFIVKWGIKGTGANAAVQFLADGQTTDCTHVFTTSHRREVKTRGVATARRITAEELIDCARSRIRDLIEMAAGSIEYVIDGQPCVYPPDECPRCGASLDVSFVDHGCPHCQASVGKDVELC